MIECPVCGKMNVDDWPIDIDGKVEWGGCQMCWEAGSKHGRKWKTNQIELYQMSKWFRGPETHFDHYRKLREMNEQ